MKRTRVGLLVSALTLLLCLVGALRDYGVSYNSKHVCGLKGSSVVLGCQYHYSWIGSYEEGMWYRERANNMVKRHDDSDYPSCSLTLSKLTDDHRDIYHFLFYTTLHRDWITSSQGQGIILTVTDVQVHLDSMTSVEGDALTLTCHTTCTPTNKPIFLWYKDGKQLMKQTQYPGLTHKLLLDPVSNLDTGNYSCAIKGHESLPSILAFVNIKYAPKNITVSAFPSKEVVEGSSVTFNCLSEANPPVHNYTWHLWSSVDNNYGVNSSEIGRGQQLVILNASTRHHGHYFCRAQNDIGVRDSAAIPLDVRYSPRNVSVFPSHFGDLLSGTSVTLTCNSDDANPKVHTYTWLKRTADGFLLRGIGKSITFNVTAETTGLHYCRATNEVGSSESEEVKITLSEEHESNLLLYIEIASMATLTLVLVILGIVWLRIRKRKRQTETEREEELSDSSSVYGDISVFSHLRKPQYTVDPAFQDDVIYACIDFGKSADHEGSTTDNMRSPHVHKQEEDVVYSAVKFSRPSAAI